MRRHASQFLFEKCVGSAFDRAGDVGFGGAAMRRIVLEAAVRGRVVGGRDDDAVGKAGAAPLIVARGSRARSPVSACNRPRRRS